MKFTPFIFLFVLATTVQSLKLQKPHFLSDQFINTINKAKSTWKAGRNFHEDTPDHHIKKLLGVHSENSKYKPLTSTNKDVNQIGDLPENFDARTKWPKCKSIGMIRAQGACGSCWAFGAVEAMSDRICIHSGQRLQTLVSAEDLTACCDDCGFGCEGGITWAAWEFWHEIGISTGGLYNAHNQGCKAYSIKPCEQTSEEFNLCEYDVNTPRCLLVCDAGSNMDYSRSLTFGREPYLLDSEEDIMADIYENGPVEASFEVYEDFLHYKHGVYQYVYGDYLGTHAVKILGWGVENGTKYWLVANSWNSDWGDLGYFKILRGEDHCDIEEIVIAALPRL